MMVMVRMTIDITRPRRIRIHCSKQVESAVQSSSSPSPSSIPPSNTKSGEFREAITSLTGAIYSSIMVMSPTELFNTIIESIRQLFTTPILNWTWGQWLLMLVLLSILSSCCGGSVCLCSRGRQRRRYRDQNGNYYSSSNRVNKNNDGDDDDGDDFEMQQQQRRQKESPASTTTPYRLAEDV